MMKKFLIIIFTTLALTLNVNAGSDGDLILKKNEPSEVKDCFEKINRVTFAFNQTLDGVIFKPVASLYRKLPSPAKTGVSNSLENISHLLTIPNNVLQGDYKQAGINTGRFIINTTLGILGIFDVAQYLGLTNYEKEDYGQSLAKAGVGPGCYIVLPILGPSTTRDAISSGCANLPIACLAIKSDLALTGSSAILTLPSQEGVSTVPGKIALQRIPSLM